MRRIRWKSLAAGLIALMLVFMTVFPNWIGGMATFTEVEHFYDPSNPDLAKYSIWKKI